MASLDTSFIKEPERKRVIEAMLEIAGRSEWKLKKDKPNLKGYQLSTEDSPFVAIKAVAIVPATPQQIVAWCSTEGPGWEVAYKITDTMFMSGSFKRHNANLATTYCQFATPTPIIKNRDFVFSENFATFPDGTVVNSCVSIESDLHPPNPKFVRGEISISGFIYKPVGDGSCEVTYIAQVDPKGWIPVWVVNMTCMDQCDNVKRIAHHWEKIKNEKQ